jgi:hypothetical protein
MKMGYKNDHRTTVSSDYVWGDWYYIHINSRIYGSVTIEKCFKETASVAHCSQCRAMKSIIGAAEFIRLHDDDGQLENTALFNILQITYFLTPCSRVLLQKLTGSQLVKKYPAFYGTLKFITAFTSAHHLSLS